jgi:hypothetical protein
MDKSTIETLLQALAIAVKRLGGSMEYGEADVSVQYDLKMTASDESETIRFDVREVPENEDV